MTEPEVKLVSDFYMPAHVKDRLGREVGYIVQIWDTIIKNEKRFIVSVQTARNKLQWGVKSRERPFPTFDKANRWMAHEVATRAMRDQNKWARYNGLEAERADAHALETHLINKGLDALRLESKKESKE